jgi:hypothetical protein
MACQPALVHRAGIGLDPSSSSKSNAHKTALASAPWRRLRRVAE